MHFNKECFLAYWKRDKPEAKPSKTHEMVCARDTGSLKVGKNGEEENYSDEPRRWIR